MSRYRFIRAQTRHYPVRQLCQVLGAVASYYRWQRKVLGGFSAGGQLAITYAETLVRDSTRQPWRVRAVLEVDPPLDL